VQRIHDWMNERLPGIVQKLEMDINKQSNPHSIEEINLSSRHVIYDILDDLLGILFPNAYSRESVSRDELNFYLNDQLRHIGFRLGKYIREVFKHRCYLQKCENCRCEDRADEALEHLIESLPSIRAILMEDIQAAYDGDPAARSYDEIILSYPCIEAIATHRLAHLLYELDVPIIPRIMSERSHSRTGIDIHPGATIQARFFIDHGTGVVIGETCRIGRNVKIYQGVTLGALSFPLDDSGHPIKGNKRHPDIEDDVIIYANTTILGGKTVIGKGAIVGGNNWIIESVPPGSKIYRK